MDIGNNLDPPEIKLCEKKLVTKHICYVILFISHVWKDRILEVENRLGLGVGVGGREVDELVKGQLEGPSGVGIL